MPGLWPVSLQGLDYAARTIRTSKRSFRLRATRRSFPESGRRRSVAQQPEGGIVLAESGDRVHPVFGLWPVALADDLRHFLTVDWTTARCSPSWIGTPMPEPPFAIETHRHYWDCQVDPFFNINTPEDIAEAEAILVRDGTAAEVARMRRIPRSLASPDGRIRARRR
jgi:hypothetical protein